VFASIVLITMPIDSVSWSRNASCTALKRSNDASSSTPLVSPSKMIGITRMLLRRRGAEPENTLR
jgi:hypothetical protein